MRFEFVPHRVFDVLRILPDHALDDGRTNVGGHHDDCVFKVHGATLSIGQTPIVQHLQQDVENIRMGFFNFVEQQHAIGFATYGFSQITAFVVAHISRRCTNQTANRMLLHELAHVDANHVVFAVKQKASQSLAQLGLADACGA